MDITVGEVSNNDIEMVSQPPENNFEEIGPQSPGNNDAEMMSQQPGAQTATVSQHIGTGVSGPAGRPGVPGPAAETAQTPKFAAQIHDGTQGIQDSEVLAGLMDPDIPLGKDIQAEEIPETWEGIDLIGG